MADEPAPTFKKISTDYGQLSVEQVLYRSLRTLESINTKLTFMVIVLVIYILLTVLGWLLSI